MGGNGLGEDSGKEKFEDLRLEMKATRLKIEDLMFEIEDLRLKINE